MNRIGEVGMAESTKVCYAASSGGHMEELSRLKPLVTNRDIVFTEKSSYTVVDWCSKVYFVSQINRKELLFVIKFIALFFRSFFILLKEKPDVIVSTGALATFPISFLGKIMRKKIIYIESFARVDEASLTGRLMYKIADLFIVQWEDMLKVFPNAIYVGGIF